MCVTLRALASNIRCRWKTLLPERRSHFRASLRLRHDRERLRESNYTMLLEAGRRYLEGASVGLVSSASACCFLARLHPGMARTPNISELRRSVEGQADSGCGPVALRGVGVELSCLFERRRRGVVTRYARPAIFAGIRAGPSQMAFGACSRWRAVRSPVSRKLAPPVVAGAPSR